MHKRVIACIFILALLCFTAGFLSIRASNVRYCKAAEFESIMEARNETNEDLISQISVDGQILVMDEGTDTFYYSLDEGNKLPYTLVIESFSGDSAVKLAVKKVSITEEFIEGNETAELVAYTDELYRKYCLKVTLLPIMEIECEDTEAEDYVSMAMRLYDNRENMSDRVIEAEGKMHVRGGTSRNYPKKGYRIELKKEEKASLLGMRTDDDWILYAAYNDQERVRNVFSTRLWKEGCAENNSFGLDNGVEYKYVELFMNGSYYGLYALGYPVDDKVLSTAEGEYIYKKDYWDWEAAVDLSKTGAVSGYDLQTDSTDIIKAWQPLRDYYKLLYSADAGTEKLKASVDIANSIDIYIFLNLIQGADHVDSRSIHNVYITAKLEDGGYVMLYTPWDMDQSWGNIWSKKAQNNCNVYGVDVKDNYVLNLGAVPSLVNMGDDEIITAVKQRWIELRNDAWSDESVNALLDEYESDIYKSGAYKRDVERWPDSTYRGSDGGLGIFREYVLERLSYLDEYYGSLGD